MSKKLFFLHSTFGLISGIFLLVLSLTGSILCFKEELHPLVYPELYTATATDKTPDQLYQQLLREYPEYYPMRLYTPAFSGTVYTAHLLGRKNINDQLDVFYEDGRWRIIPDSWLHFAEELHIYFKLNYYPGMLLNFCLSIVLTGLTVTGFVVYRKKIVKLITFNEKIRLKSMGNWHAVSGLIALLFHLIMAATSCIVTFSAVAGGPLRETMFQTSVPANFDIDRLIPLAEKFRMKEQAKLKTIMFLNGKTMFHFESLQVKNGALGQFTRVVLDPVSGKKMDLKGSTEPPVMRALNSSVSFHFGNFSGIIVKSLYSLGGLFISFMTISGAIIYFKRSKKVIWKTDEKKNKTPKPKKPIQHYLLLGARYWFISLGVFLITGFFYGLILGDVLKGMYYLSVVLYFPAILNVVLLFLTLPFYFLYKLIRWKKIPHALHAYCAVSCTFFVLSVIWMLLGSF